MTKTSRRIGANEWIQDYFSPVLGVLSSEDAELLCRKNNLTLVELLQPFGRVNEHLTVKDPEGVIHNVPTLNINFQVCTIGIWGEGVLGTFRNSLILLIFNVVIYRIFEEIRYVYFHRN